MAKLTAKVMERDGCAIRYWICPEAPGPWVALLHGAGADHRMFDSQVPVLLGAYKLLLWDARGHGLSRPMGPFSMKRVLDDLLAIMDREGIASTALAGVSMGGNLAQEAAFHHPERVSGLVLADCTCNTGRLTAAEKLGLWMTPAILWLYPWGPSVRLGAKSSSVKPEVWRYGEEVFRLIGKRDYVTIMSELRACLHAEEGYEIAHPVLLVCGEHDGLGNIRKIAPGWARRMPHCEFHVIPDAGHTSNMDNPAEFNRLLADFLARR
jgi:pimeloyl-ACP methyl ester carboxylesterase